MSTMPKRDPCQKEACDIQKCLQAHKYKESSCKEVIKALGQCCEKLSPGRSICCSGFYKSQQRKKLPPTALR